MKKAYQSEGALLELATRVFCDKTPEYTFAPTYLVGQTSDNQASVLLKGLELCSQHLCFLILSDGPTDHGYPGFDAWKRQLTNRGFPEHFVVRNKVSDSAYNTYTEFLALINLAKKEKWEYLRLVAAPFHMLRAFCTAASIVIRQNQNIKLYSCPGLVLPWKETARHSQGTTVGTRAQLIYGELDRINAYHEKGDLVSVEEILNYLNQRDAE